MKIHKLSAIFTSVLALNLSVKALDLSFETAPAEQVTTYYGELTGKTVIQNPSVNAMISVQGSNLSVTEALQALETVLEMNNITLVPVGDKFLKVVPSNSVRKEGAPFEIWDESSTIPESDKIVTKIISVNHTDAQDALNALQQFAGRNGNIQILENTGSLIITDSALNLKRMTEILEYIDQPAEKVEPRIYHLKYAEAGQIASTLNELVEIAKEQSNRPAVQPIRTIPGVIRATRTTNAPSVQIDATASDSGDDMVEGFVKITSDERTNILIIFTKEANFEFFDKIIKVLDVPVEPEVLAEVVQLEYADAEETASLLNSLVGGSKSSDKNRLQINTDGGVKTSVTRESSEQTQLGNFSEKVNVLADKRTNSVMLMGSKSDLDALKDMISKLDVMLAQVQIEAVILEVNLDDKVQSGISWFQKQLASDGNIYQTGFGDVVGALPGVISSNATDFIVQGNGLSHQMFLEGLDLSAVIRLSQENGDSRLISTPVILTFDNTEAEINISKQEPIVTSTSYSDDNDRNSARYEYKDIGTKLTVTPHINPNRYVIMDIEQTADQIAGSTSIGNETVPRISKREMKASIGVPDRGTVVLGGLIENQVKQSTTKIPILGDIPLVGRLFRNDKDEDTRSELIVLMTPYVMMTPQEAHDNSKRLYEASEARKTQWPKGWSESALRNELSEQEIKAKEKQRKKEDKAEIKNRIAAQKENNLQKKF